MNADDGLSALLKSIEQDEPLTAEAQEQLDNFLRSSGFGRAIASSGALIRHFNGHMREGAYWHDTTQYWSPEAKRTERMLKELFSISLEPGEYDALEAAMAAKESLPTPISLGRSARFRCTYCDERIRLGFDGVDIHLLGEACPRPEGLEYTEFELNVPSGRIVVDDNLVSPWFPGLDVKKQEDGIFGEHKQVMSYAVGNLASGFVGNTCPSVRRNGEDKFVIVNWADEIWDDEADDEIPNPETCPWGETVAGVCTDLWRYSIADSDELRRRISHYTPERSLEGRENDEVTGWTHSIVDVKPGVYRFRHHQGVDRDAPVVLFAEFEWVREPDPVVDLLGAERAADLNALEILIQGTIDWPTLYMPANGEDYEDRKTWADLNLAQKLGALAGTANQNMCVLGGGIEWHENGFVRCSVSAEAREMAAAFSLELGLEPGVVPSFSGLDWMSEKARETANALNMDDSSLTAFSWYPISAGYGGLCMGSGMGKDADYQDIELPAPMVKLNPSFVALGLNIAQHIILNPEKPDLNDRVWPPEYMREHVRDRLHLALRCYRGFRRHYPEVEPQDSAFDQWVMRPKLEAGDAAILLDTKDCAFVLTSDKGSVTRGHLARLGHSDPNNPTTEYGDQLTLLTRSEGWSTHTTLPIGSTEAWWRPSTEGGREVTVRKIMRSGLVEISYTHQGRKRVARVPADNLRRDLQPGDLAQFRHAQWRFRETTGMVPTKRRGEALPAGRLVYFGSWMEGKITFIGGDKRKVRGVENPDKIKGTGGELRDPGNPMVTYLGKAENRRARFLWRGANGFVEEVELYRDVLIALPTVEDWINAYDLGPKHPPQSDWGREPGVLDAAKFKFVEFDASPEAVRDGHCWHPRNPGVGGCWANRNSAQRFALPVKTIERGKEYWMGNAGKSVPLKFVARVIRASPNKVLEIAFDYGTPEMKGKEIFGIREESMAGVRLFDSQEEYDALLPSMAAVYADMENLIDTKVKEEKEATARYLAEYEAKQQAKQAAKELG